MSVITDWICKVQVAVYKAQLRRLVEKYADQVRPSTAKALRNMVMSGEWVLTAHELTWGLIAMEVPVSEDDAAILKLLLRDVTLPPDTPRDLADRLLVQ